MSLLVRTLFVWLLMLAIPAQGMAAATMAFCGPGHHGSASARVASSVSSEHPHDGGFLAVHGLHTGAVSEATSVDDPLAAKSAGHVPQQKCSACASCCSFGALFGPAPVVPATEPAPTVFITTAPTVDAFAADGPDRPPRNIHA
ncbi:MAG: hypothetical protein ACK5W4_02960 [Inhella sp.]|jgi:hypothetical protein|uniref:hypothetical protein n=1 Tax=Inhella sp. TaxID=1921806 RepID=UPI0022BEDC01|nr:hypothetical protein [Polaromonas sp.]